RLPPSTPPSTRRATLSSPSTSPPAGAAAPHTRSLHDALPISEIVNKLNGALKEILNQPEVKESLLAQGAIAGYTTPEEASTAIIDEYNKWVTLIKEANISVN